MENKNDIKEMDLGLSRADMLEQLEKVICLFELRLGLNILKHNFRGEYFWAMARICRWIVWRISTAIT